MQILSVPDFEQYADVLQGVDGRYRLTGREVGGWTAGTAVAGRLAIQVGDEGGPNYYEGASHKDAVVLLLAISDPGIFRLNGSEFDQTSMGVIGVNKSVAYNARAANRTSLVILPADLFHGSDRFDSHETALLQALNGVLSVDPSRLAMLRALIERLATVQESLSAPAERVVEDEFIARVFDVVGSRVSADPGRGRPWVSREHVLRKVRDLIASAGDRVLHVEDLCRIGGVSERTLRTVFNETYGIGPIRYLRHRRLHLVRAALRAADRSRQTVASIAADFGFWEFGRFAREYRALFGELPSRTLANARHDGIVLDRRHTLTAHELSAIREGSFR